MIFGKWIRCQVEPHNKNSFSAAQARWSELAGLRGFLGQAGGWNVQQPTEACLVSFWKDADAYQDFMNNHHDPIFHRTGQAHSYNKITIEFFQGSFQQTTSLPEALITACQKSSTLLVSQDDLSGPHASRPSFFQIHGNCLNDPKSSILFQILDEQTVEKHSDHPSPFFFVVALEKAWLVV